MSWVEVAIDVHQALDGTVVTRWRRWFTDLSCKGLSSTFPPSKSDGSTQAFGDAPLEPELGDGPNSTLEQRHGDIIRSWSWPPWHWGRLRRNRRRTVDQSLSRRPTRVRAIELPIVRVAPPAVLPPNSPESFPSIT